MKIVTRIGEPFVPSPEQRAALARHDLKPVFGRRVVTGSGSPSWACILRRESGGMGGGRTVATAEGPSRVVSLDEALRIFEEADHG